jgi:ParB-like chromosome segregation protein Spo0J
MPRVAFFRSHPLGKKSMNIEMRKLSDIRPYENNPRRNDDAVDAVAASIREFGFRQPIVIDEEGVIVVGHTRYKAALKLGLETVPVHVATGLTPAQLKAYRIADNQTARLSEFDNDKLAAELIELQAMDFDLDLTGFTPEELIGLMEPGTPDGMTDPDAIPEPPDEAITQPGDLWVLGSHRLLCADSRSATALPTRLFGQISGIFAIL